MNYEERITCFIDLLGFKSAIDQSLEQNEIRDALYKNIHDLTSAKLLKQVYGDIPVFLLDKEASIKAARDVIKDDLIQKYSNKFPLTITQFSDSFVLSCPSDNSHSCALLLKCVYIIHLICYFNLGMMVRGGISIGKLVHEENGALFGPAMNEAYALESKSAIYPRVVASSKAFECLSNSLVEHTIMDPFKTAFDGHNVFDLISIFSWPACIDIESSDVDNRMKKIEDDLLKNSSISHPKIAYLLDQWNAAKSQYNNSLKIDAEKN